MAASYTKLAQNTMCYGSYAAWFLCTRITDAFVAANDHLTFCGKKMSEAIDNMDAYIQLTDDVFQQILQSTGDEMKKVINQLLFAYNCIHIYNDNLFSQYRLVISSNDYKHEICTSALINPVMIGRGCVLLISKRIFAEELCWDLCWPFYLPRRTHQHFWSCVRRLLMKQHQKWGYPVMTFTSW